MVRAISFSDLPKVKMRKFLDELNTGEQGLSNETVLLKQQQYGYNTIAENKKNSLVRFLSNFLRPVSLLVAFAGMLSLFMHLYTDFFIIMILLLVTVISAYWYDYKTGKLLESLKQKLAPQVRAMRNGKWCNLPARELVPGDIVSIRPGNIIAADTKLIDGRYLECDESAITGKSVPVEKHTGDDLFCGSVVLRGEMTAVVTATGEKTFLHKNGKLKDKGDEKSHFDQAILKINNYQIMLVIVLILVLTFVTVFRNEHFIETMRFMTVLAVTAIPFFLPAVLILIMATGAVKLARRKAIVRQLAAVEKIAGVDIICTNKTGTLTRNKVTIGKPFAATDFTSEDTLVYAILASRKEDNDPIDNAIMTVGKRENIDYRLSQFTTVEFIPFNTHQMRTEAHLYNFAGDRIYVSKGAPGAITELYSDNRSNGSNFVEQKVEEFARMGYRTIAVAVKSDEVNWQLVGLIPLFDSLNNDVLNIVSDLPDMGINLKIITADTSAIVRQLAQKLGLHSKIYQSKELRHITQYQLEEVVENAAGFAEVYPEQKYLLIKILQKLTHRVGLTGKNANDTPALHAADCGIALDVATDAAKSAASLVVTEPGLQVIIQAINESRKIFQRMNSFAVHCIAGNIHILVFLSLSIIFFNFYPVTAIMMVLLTVMNFLPAFAIAGDNAAVSQKPQKWSMSLILGPSIFFGLTAVVFSIIVFYLGESLLHLNSNVMQSVIFLNLVIAGHLRIFSSRTQGYFWSLKPSAGLFLSVITVVIIATLVVIGGWFVTPVSWELAVYVWIFTIITFIQTDLLKVYFIKKFIGVSSELKR